MASILTDSQRKKLFKIAAQNTPTGILGLLSDLGKYSRGISALSGGQSIIGSLLAPIGSITGLSSKDEKSLGGAIPYLIAKKFVPITARVRLPDTVLQSAAQSFGATLGKSLAETMSSPLSLLAGMGQTLVGSSNAIIDQLRKIDDIIGKADKNLLVEAYETMKKVAPTLAKDINAVRSYLREVAMAGTGPDYNTIKQLADAEKTIMAAKGLGR
jgi:hypothetical protein